MSFKYHVNTTIKGEQKGIGVEGGRTVITGGKSRRGTIAYKLPNHHGVPVTFRGVAKFPRCFYEEGGVMGVGKGKGEWKGVVLPISHR